MNPLFTFTTALALLLPALHGTACGAPAASAIAPEPGADRAEPNYRHRSFKAYLPINEISRRYKVANYSSFENPTGIFFAAGDTATVTLSGSAGQKVSLIVHDFEEGGTHDEYPLQEGKNTLHITHRGLAYLNYRSTSPDECPAVKVDIEGGQINGIFTRQGTADTWRRLLANAKCNILDLTGERCQLAFDVESLRKSCPDSGPELLAIYDDIIRMEQEDILGWHLDGSHPGNHILGRVQWRGFMHADGLGAAFHVSTIPGLSNPENLRRGAWGVAHEFGHVNQTRPGLCWAGTTEVTNNICSAWVNYKLNPHNMRLEHEYTQNADRVPMVGGRFDCYINNGLVRRRLWQYHGGPDDGNTTPPGERTGDHFVSVCPLWQLQLYMAVANHQPDFYPNIYRQVRVTDERELTPGQLRVLFFKRACDSARLDLSEFFVKLGMLAPMDRYVQDYISAHMTITREMCREAIDYASRYPKPNSSVIFYITANSVDIFAKRLPIVPPPADFHPAITHGRLEIPADCWQNAVAFECYADGKLVRVSLRGLNHRDGASTTVICPEGTDTVQAVQWDGKRFTVLSTRS